LPGFFTRETGIELRARAESAGELARMFHAHRSLGRQQALLVVQRPPAEVALPRDEVERAVADALAAARAAGVHGAAVTPYLLTAVTEFTHGQSLQANLALLEANARLAGEIALELGSAT
jgi:pseudouridine-5'-phosphate glycosidase